MNSSKFKTFKAHFGRDASLKWSIYQVPLIEVCLKLKFWKNKNEMGVKGGREKKKKKKYLLFYLGYPSNPWTIKLCSGKLKLYHTSSQFILYINQLRSILAFTCYFLQCNIYNLFSGWVANICVSMFKRICPFFSLSSINPHPPKIIWNKIDFSLQWWNGFSVLNQGITGKLKHTCNCVEIYMSMIKIPPELSSCAFTYCCCL